MQVLNPFLPALPSWSIHRTACQSSRTREQARAYMLAIALRNPLCLYGRSCTKFRIRKLAFHSHLLALI
jgi:hypothetical protein